jgi:hypothetical protein
LAVAKNAIESMEANLGMTSILPPLLHILQHPSVPHPKEEEDEEEGGKILRRLFVLTDGRVDEPSSVIQFVKQNSNDFRVFAFGIGQVPKCF